MEKVIINSYEEFEKLVRAAALQRADGGCGLLGGARMCERQPRGSRC